jgi:hypothetical protein
MKLYSLRTCNKAISFKLFSTNKYFSIALAPPHDEQQYCWVGRVVEIRSETDGTNREDTFILIEWCYSKDDLSHVSSPILKKSGHFFGI